MGSSKEIGVAVAGFLGGIPRKGAGREGKICGDAELGRSQQLLPSAAPWLPPVPQWRPLLGKAERRVAAAGV